MVYTILSGIIIFLALIVVLLAGRLLFKGSWIYGWLRGMSGLVLLFFAVVLALAAFDFYSYQQISKEHPVATISFTEISPQDFKVSLVGDNGIEETYQLRGDLWQLDARVIKWSNGLAGLGLKTGYRLDRLSGRYYSLEKEHNEQRTVYQLGESSSMIDLWSWLREYGQGFAVVDATYGSATYMPMEDGALFSVTISNSGLVARPLNDRAKTAITRWQ